MPEGCKFSQNAVIAASAGAGAGYVHFFKLYYGKGLGGSETLTGGHNGVVASKIYLNEHAQTDFRDVRFYDNDGVTALDQFRDSYTDGVSALYAVEVQDSLDANVTVGVWYGNNALTLKSSAADTFKRVISSGVVLALPMNEGAGLTCYDYSGNSNTGTFGSGALVPSWVTTGKFGNAVSFDGVDDEITVEDNASLNFGVSDFSIWVYMKYLAGGDNWGLFVSKYNADAGIWFTQDPTGQVLGVRVESTYGRNALGRDIVDDAQHSLCVIADRSGVATFYVDAATSGSTLDISGEVATVLGNVAKWNIGGLAGANCIKGVMSGQFAFSRLLTVDEITDLHVYYPQCSSANLGSLYLRSFVYPEPQPSNITNEIHIPDTHTGVPVRDKRRLDQEAKRQKILGLLQQYLEFKINYPTLN